MASSGTNVAPMIKSLQIVSKLCDIKDFKSSAVLSIQEFLDG